MGVKSSLEKLQTEIDAAQKLIGTRNGTDEKNQKKLEEATKKLEDTIKKAKAAFDKMRAAGKKLPLNLQGVLKLIADAEGDFNGLETATASLAKALEEIAKGPK
jgi:seryl-tRNA synthetase